MENTIQQVVLKGQKMIALVEVPTFSKRDYPTTEKLACLYYDIVETMNITFENITELDKVFKEYSEKNFFFLLEVSKKIIEMLTEFGDIEAKRIASKHEKAIYRFKNTKMEPDKQARINNAVKGLFDDTVIFFQHRTNRGRRGLEHKIANGAN